MRIERVTAGERAKAHYLQIEDRRWVEAFARWYTYTVPYTDANKEPHLTGLSLLEGGGSIFGVSMSVNGR